MYIFSFNINKKENNSKNIRVLTEQPIILINDSPNLIIEEIRNLIKYNFYNISKKNLIPLIDLRIGLTTIYTDENKFIKTHKFSINLENVRETINIIKTINDNN